MKQFLEHLVGEIGLVVEKRVDCRDEMVSGVRFQQKPSYPCHDHLVLAGLGLAYLPEDQVEKHILDGKLVRVLDDWCAPFRATTSAIQAGGIPRQPFLCLSRRCANGGDEVWMGGWRSALGARA